MMKRVKQINIHCIIQIILFILLTAADRLTKTAACLHLKDKNDIEFIHRIISFHYLENTGAAFGILKNSRILFIIISVIIFIIAAVLYILIIRGLKKYLHRQETVSEKTVRNMLFLEYILAILGAGAVGNLMDRILYGFVIDFIKTDFISFPVFNVADIYVTVSVVILLIFFIFVYKEDKNFHII